MSSSQLPVAFSLERQLADGSTRLLALLMLLSLVDGIFAALVLAGALDSWVGVIEVRLLVFGGSATVAVVLAEMDTGPGETTVTAAIVGIAVVIGAVVVAALAPTVEAVLAPATFERFAAVVILAVAAKTASARIDDWLPRPAIIVGLELVASVDPANARFVRALEPGLLMRAGVAGLFRASLRSPSPRWARGCATPWTSIASGSVAPLRSASCRLAFWVSSRATPRVPSPCSVSPHSSRSIRVVHASPRRSTGRIRST